MGWFTCTFSSDQVSVSFPKHIEHIDSFTGGNFRVVVGGNKNTLYYEFNKEKEYGWVVSGIGIDSSSHEKILNRNDWGKLLEKEIPPLDNIDGHFAMLKFFQDEVHLFTDQTGLRDIYYFKKDNYYSISTRLDLLLKEFPVEINFEVFGSRWLLFNQLSQESFLKGITRVVGGDQVIINKKGVKTLKNELMINSDKEFYANDFREKLKSLISISVNFNQKISLGLSGGLDSRVLLSSLLNIKNEFGTYTFGHPEIPDFKVAKQITDKFELPHQHLYSEINNKDHLISLIENYAKDSFGINPVSTALQLRYYNKIKSGFIIDGGFGEIWRREFLNNLLLRGKKYLINRNVKGIVNFLKHNRADVFNEEIMQVMYEGIQKQVADLINEMPSIEEIGIENWLDLFSLKTRLPNYYGHEQNRLDEEITNFMPFAQKSLLKNLFSIPVNERKNGKLFRSVIRDNYKQLSKFPLAKGNVTYPFKFGSVSSRIYTKLFSRFKQIDINEQKELFRTLKEYILDLINSSDTQSYFAYDKNKLKKLAEEFNSDNQGSYQQTDWFLSFELFRKSILEKS